MVNKNKLFRMLTKLSGDVATNVRENEEVREAIARGLVARLPDGLVVTEKGRQFVFQRRCADFLNALQENKSPVNSASVIKWLNKHEFILEVKSSGGLSITPRGRDWVSQIKE